MATNRDFDIAILGATGWTATMCCEHITRHLPTTLRWTIAGRSRSKLEALARRLRSLDPDRPAPRISTLPPSLDLASLEPLVRRAAVVINGIGPYHRLSSPVVEACARAGTHYVDFTTETPWVAEMARRHEQAARASGAAVIPSISLASSPSDLVAWLVTSSQSDAAHQRVSEVLASGKLTVFGLAGGTTETVVGTAERYGISWLWAPDPYILCPQPRQPPPPSSSLAKESWLTRLLPGYRHDGTLGHLATSFAAASNEAVVQRSAAQRPDVYGDGFVYREYVPVAGPLGAVAVHLATRLAVLLLAVPWVRTLVRATTWRPGTGPDREASRRAERADFKAVGFARGRTEPVATAQFVYVGALVDVSAVLAVEAADTLLELARQGKAEGGFLTPSWLGWPFVERLRVCGVDIRVGEVE
ncbi:hypothetical protein F4779DRAFT_73354 [Xylariaceae sp. FL0662B]|nr:hypothetical protein F4779DRAFT_73354 [Xylariaceae sp. FL0662B]